MSKGSKPRPIEVERKVFEDNWDRIFNKTSRETVRKVKEEMDELERLNPYEFYEEEVTDEDYLIPDWSKKAGEDDYISKIDLLGNFYGRIDGDNDDVN